MPNTAKTPGNKPLKPILKLLDRQPIHQFVTDYLQEIKTEDSYEQAKGVLKELMLETDDSPDNPYNGLMECFAILVERYEDIHYSMKPVSARDMLKFLMDQHGLRQKDLPELGNQAKVSDILNGRRKLSLTHIQRLAERFGVSPAVFFQYGF